MQNNTSIQDLRALKDIIDQSIDSIIEEWSEHGAPNSLGDPTPLVQTDGLPSQRLYETTAIAIGAAGMLQAILKDPRMYISEMICQYLECQALRVISVHHIPDILHEAMVHGKKDGLNVQEICEKTGFEYSKCARTMRMLASNHIFTQTGPDRFANNRSSAALVGNKALQSFVDLQGAGLYEAAHYLVDDIKDSSLDLNTAPITKDIVYNPAGLNLWDYNDANPIRHDVFAAAMAGAGQYCINAIMSDFPWGALGHTTIVDVGGGIGALTLPLLSQFPNLSLVLQDRAPIRPQALQYWNKNLPAAVKNGRMRFQDIDFFQVNPISSANVYALRYILHNWNDAMCVRIISGIKNAMTADSRLLILDALVLPAWIPDGGESTLPVSAAPSPLPPNAGTAHRYTHQFDMLMWALLNGSERTIDNMTSVVERAGLKVKKIWPCRVPAMFLTECVLPS